MRPRIQRVITIMSLLISISLFVQAQVVKIWEFNTNKSKVDAELYVYDKPIAIANRTNLSFTLASKNTRITDNELKQYISLILDEMPKNGIKPESLLSFVIDFNATEYSNGIIVELKKRGNWKECEHAYHCDAACPVVSSYMKGVNAFSSLNSIFMHYGFEVGDYVCDGETVSVWSEPDLNDHSVKPRLKLHASGLLHIYMKKIDR